MNTPRIDMLLGIAEIKNLCLDCSRQQWFEECRKIPSFKGIFDSLVAELLEEGLINFDKRIKTFKATRKGTDYIKKNWEEIRKGLWNKARIEDYT